MTNKEAIQKVKRIKVTNVLLRKSLYTFVRYFFLKQYKRKYADWEHLRQISDVLEKVLSGEIKRLIINIAPRYGKAIDCETDILTTEGWKKAKDVNVGDYFFGSDGNPTKVTARYPQGITDAYRVKFSDGTSLVTCSEHLWALNHRDLSFKNNYQFKEIRKTKELIGTLKTKCGTNNNWWIPTIEGLPRFVESIEQVEDRETICFTVDADDHLFCAGRDMIVTHNTEIAVKAFIAYALAINPSAKFIHTTYSAALALDNSSTAKDLITSDYYQEIFPKVQLKQNQKSKQKWETTDGGGVYATSSGGQITGFGAGKVDDYDEKMDEYIERDKELSHDIPDDIFEDLLEGTGVDWLGKKASFGGAIIIDDPNKPDDADSETLRNKVNERYDSTISNRVNSRNTPIIIIQQRTHEDDLSGYLIRKQKTVEEGGIWHVLKLASIKEDGTALCPQKHTIEELKELENHNDIVFQRQHMQNPKPKSGLLFPIEDLNFEDFNAIEAILDNADFKYSAADPANKGGDDFAGGNTSLVGKKIYIKDILYNTSGADFNESAFSKMVLKHNPASVGVEAVFGWIETAKRIKEYIEEEGFEGEFRNLRPRQQKHSRIANRASFIRNNFVFRSDWENYPEYAKFMRNLTSYLKIQEAGNGNKHDDAPDLCEMIADYYETNFPYLYALKSKE